MATVMASGDVAQGHIASGFSPWLWNKLKNASQEDTDPGRQTFSFETEHRGLTEHEDYIENHSIYNLYDPLHITRSPKDLVHCRQV